MNNPERTILLVEDQADTADMLAEMLTLDGYEVVISDNGRSAMEVLENHALDGVVLDLMLPVISGLDVLRFIRSNPDTRQMPVVVVSARSLPADIQQGKDQGASDYLTKPVSYPVLKQAMDGLFSKNQGRQRL